MRLHSPAASPGPDRPRTPRAGEPRTPDGRADARRVMGWVLAALACAEILSATGIVSAPHAVISDHLAGGSWPFLSVALAGTLAIHLARAGSWRERLAAVAAGLTLEAVFVVVRTLAGREPSFAAHVVDAGTGLGAGSVCVQLGALAFSVARNRPTRTHALVESLLVPAFVLASQPFLELTAALHPLTLDTVVYRAEAGLGVQLSFVLGRLFERAFWLRTVCHVVYVALPLLVAMAHVARTRDGRPSGIEALESFLLVGVIGFCLYHVFPVVGPIWAFGKVYPATPPDAVAVPGFATLMPPIERNCMPSLHTAWAIVIFLRTRGLGLPLRVAGGIALAATVTATLGLGAHYALDLVVAVPFAVGVDALPETARAGWPRPRVLAILACVALTAAWMLAIAFAPRAIGFHPAIAWTLVAATVAIAVACRRILCRTIEFCRYVPDVVPSGERRPIAVLAAVFVLSGLAGLFYEVVFAKSLALAFGSTSRAATTVLSTYMGGLALGAWIGGRLAARSRDPLRLYAICEIGVGLWRAATPWMFGWLRALYAAIGAGADPASPALVAVQIGLGAAALLPPTVLMGMTMPALARELERRRHSLGRSVALLYSANTLGAASGALVSGYLALPAVGVMASTLIAVALNLSAAVAALRLRARQGTLALADTEAPVAPSFAAPSRPRAAGIAALVVLGVGGAVTLALEVIDVHLLAVVAGTSAYAFSLMLFAFLVGLSAGAALSRRFLVGRGFDPLSVLSSLELGLVAVLLGGVFLWDSIPAYFASFETYPLVRGFAEREVVRGVVCCVIMIPPAALIGAIYPVAVDLYATSAGGSGVRALGRASALNTLGNIAGAVIGTFVLLPWLGSLGSIHALAATALVLSLVPYAASEPRRMWRAAVPAAAGTVLFAVQPASLDWTAISSGANVYFARQAYGEAIDHAESGDGGLTTVSRSRDPDGRPVLTLLTNGKFQGDDSRSREMRAQIAFALCPLLHTSARDSALVIGYGTGVSARVVHDAGFRSLDIAELSADVVRLADRHFSTVNGHVTRRAGVRTSITDGRNYLLLGRRTFDLISMEVSSIWFAGAASLYNREFYELVRKRLADGGVLQQWVQLHHIDIVDIASVLATVRSEFASVYLYFVGGQGVIVACEKSCEPTAEALAVLDAAPGLAESRDVFGGSFASIAGARLLDPEGVDRFLGTMREAGADPEALVSTDDNLLLEYRTPRGNVRSYATSIRENLSFLARAAGRSFSGPGTNAAQTPPAAAPHPSSRGTGG